MKDKKRPAPRRGEARAIDWGEVHRRMETARAAIERRSAPSPDEKRTILKARATALAQIPYEKEAAGDSIEVLEFGRRPPA